MSGNPPFREDEMKTPERVGESLSVWAWIWMFIRLIPRAHIVGSPDVPRFSSHSAHSVIRDQAHCVDRKSQEGTFDASSRIRAHNTPPVHRASEAGERIREDRHSRVGLLIFETWTFGLISTLGTASEESFGTCISSLWSNL